MKFTLDPSSLLWDSALAQGHQYIAVATTIIELLEWLETVPAQVYMPENMFDLYEDFPYANAAFKPQVHHVSHLFWSFIASNPHKICTLASLAQVAALTPNIVPNSLGPAKTQEFFGFFGTIAVKLSHDSEKIVLLSGAPETFTTNPKQLLVAVVGMQIVSLLPVAASKVDRTKLEPYLDWRPDINRCIGALFERRYASLGQGGLRPYRLSQIIAEQMNALMYEDVDLFWEVVDCITRWAGGITAGIRPHSVGKAKRVGGTTINNIIRLDVRQGSGNRVHTTLANDGVIDFLVYQDKHDRYKINKLN